MARENYASMHGQVIQKPKIYQNAEGRLIRGLLAIKVIRRFGVGNPNGGTFDTVIILSANEEIVQKMSELKTFDLVDIKGVVSTANTKRYYTCEHCKHENITDGVATYITPIYVCKRESVAELDGLELLRERAEISNQIMIIGTVCKGPDPVGANAFQSTITQYILAVNRKYRIREDSPDKKTDYPWIKTFGEQAKKDMDALHVGSEVFINGSYQSRSVAFKGTCENCGEEYTIDDRTSEIVPFSVEYLSNFNSIDSNEDNDDAHSSVD